MPKTEPLIELTLLHACVQFDLASQGIGTADTEALGPLLASARWPRVLWLAQQHEVVPALHVVVAHPFYRDRCPSEILGQLTDFADAQRIQAMERMRELCLVQDVLDEHGIAAISIDHWENRLRETATLYKIHPGQPLGFFIPPAELERAEINLETAGHPCAIDSLTVIHRGHGVVQLNSGIGRHAAARRCWSSARSFQMAGRTIRRLAPMHALLNRVAAENEISNLPLGVAAELVVLTDQLLAAERSDLATEAAHFDLARETFAALAQCHHRLQLSVPDSVRAGAERFPAVARQTRPHSASPTRALKAPYLSTPHAVVERMLTLAGTSNADVVYDLGCGDGRLVVQAALRFGARGVGIDCDPARLAEARAQAELAGVAARTTFLLSDVLESDLKEATVVCLFLCPALMPQLEWRLRKTATTGTRVVSHNYAFTGWPPEKVEIVRVGLAKISQLYLWRLGDAHSPEVA